MVDPIDRNRSEGVLRFLLDDAAGRRPLGRIPSIKTDLASLPEGQMVWFGHSGFFLHLGGLRIAVDPGLNACFPLNGFFTPFAGADIYRARDIPPLDLLILTHDHYDHVDMTPLLELKSRTARVICPLGVGAHLEYWGWDPGIITETDWGESVSLGRKKTVLCLPSQHFSGRSFERNQTLWAGYILLMDGYTLYLSGDGGYGRHFRQIASEHPHIDLAIVEDGQYNLDWAGIHLMPAAWRAAVSELRPHCVLPSHNSKFELSRHLWTEPLEAAVAGAFDVNVPLTTPMIGQPIFLDNPQKGSQPWWRCVI